MHKIYYTHNQVFDFLNMREFRFSCVAKQEPNWFNKDGSQESLSSMSVERLFRLLSDIRQYKIIFKQYHQRTYWTNRFCEEISKRNKKKSNFRDFIDFTKKTCN